jgi:hypothetical protein
MTLEEYLRIRKLLITTTSILKVDSQNHQLNVNNLQIVNTLTVHQSILISISAVSFILTLIGGISTYLMRDVFFLKRNFRCLRFF